jgi:dTDP-4-dehydrorhamnose reductase
MPIIVLGSGGQLGKALAELCPDAVCLSRADLDIGDVDAVSGLECGGSDVVINAAAYTRVDAAETDSGAVEAWRTNAQGVANLAIHTARHEVPLVTVSTDYVFDGAANRPYTEEEPIRPANTYGRTKAAGEFAAHLNPEHYVIRTSWVYGEGENFVRTMFRLGSERSSVQVVDDQIGRPTFARDLAWAILQIVELRPPAGVYHCTGDGEPVSWAGLAASVMQIAGHECRVQPVTTEQYVASVGRRLAPRPAYSVLSTAKLAGVGVRMPDWRQSLDVHLGLR